MGRALMPSAEISVSLQQVAAPAVEAYVQTINQYSMLAAVLALLARINIVLGAFNLIPIPPLDGSKILMSILPRKQQESMMRFESMGFIVLIILLYTGLLNPLITVIQNLILSLIGIVLR